MISRIDVYNYIVNAINTTERPVWCNARYEVIPDVYPACYILQTDEAAEVQNYTLDFTDQQVRRDFEVHIFSTLNNGALAQAEGIMADVRAAFRNLYFIEDFVGKTDNDDPTAVHLVGRFHRTIGGSDQMPTA